MPTFTQGHILCPTDESAGGHETAIVNLTTGLIDANSNSVINCEFGAWIPATTTFALVKQAADAHIYIYDYTLTSTHTVDMGLGTIGVGAVSSDYLNTYYVAQAGVSSTKVKTCTTGGSVGGTTFTLPHLVDGICVNPGATILYYAVDGSGGALLTWNLSTNMAGPTFVAGMAGQQWGASALCLPSGARMGDVLFPIGPVGLPSTQVLRYTPAGALAQTYPLPTNIGGLDVHLSIDPQYPNTFWTRTFPTLDENTTVFSQFSLNGTVLQSNTQLTTASLTSIATSCPMFGWSQAVIPGYPSGPPSGPFLPTTFGFVGGQQTLPTVRKRRVPLPVLSGDRYQFPGQFVVQVEKGQGILGDPTDPAHIQMKLSVDNGETWGTERSLSVGATGQFDGRVTANSWPRARYPVLEVTVSDNANVTITDLLAKIEEGTEG